MARDFRGKNTFQFIKKHAKTLSTPKDKNIKNIFYAGLPQSHVFLFTSIRNHSNQVSYAKLGKILGKYRVLEIVVYLFQTVTTGFDSDPRYH